MLKTIGVTTAAALFAISTLAGAAGTSKDKSKSGAAGGTAQPSFASVDKNHDGKISRAEWDAAFNKKAASGGSTSSPKK